jgi:hypothetical protein
MNYRKLSIKILLVSIAFTSRNVASQEKNAKKPINAFRAMLRGVTDTSFFMFRLAKNYA